MGATCLAVSMVGVVFWSARHGCAVGAVMSNDDDPVTMIVLNKEEEIDAVLVDCDIVDLSHVQQWLIQVQADLGAIGRRGP